MVHILVEILTILYGKSSTTNGDENVVGAV
jgi:hypothetical protein